MEELARFFTSLFVEKEIFKRLGYKLGNYKLLFLILFIMVVFTYIYERV